MKSVPIAMFREGDLSEAICYTCHGWREERFEYRTIRLKKSKVDVKDVLVGVCTTCDSTVTVPHQSTPKIKEARESVPVRVDVRLPKEMRDVLWLLADEFGVAPEAFAGGVLRYYLALIAKDAKLARRVRKLTASLDAEGTPGGRLAFRLKGSLLARALESVHKVHESPDQSGLIRGIILAVRDDVFTRPIAARRGELQAIALAMG